MSTYRLKIHKYYRLSAMGAVETENVSAIIDTTSRRLSVCCGRSEKERVRILSDTQEFPKIIFRDHVYVLYSVNTKDGFRLTLDQDGIKEFKEIINSIRKQIISTKRSASPEVIFESTGNSRGNVGNEKRKNPPSHSQGAPREVSYGTTVSDRRYQSQPPRFRQESTPQVIPSCRRDTTDIFPRQGSSPQLFSNSPSYSSPIDYSQPRGVSVDLNSGFYAYNPNPHSMNSFEIRPTEHEYGESVPAKRNRHEKKNSADAYTQTDLIDILLEDEKFTMKALQNLMKMPQFKNLVESTKKQLEEMGVMEMKRLQWKTDPSGRMPPPVIHIQTSDMEKQ